MSLSKNKYICSICNFDEIRFSELTINWSKEILLHKNRSWDTSWDISTIQKIWKCEILFHWGADYNPSFIFSFPLILNLAWRNLQQSNFKASRQWSTCVILALPYLHCDEVNDKLDHILNSSSYKTLHAK